MASVAREITVSAGEAGRRLDVLCVAHLSGYSRAALQRAIKEGAITVNGQAVKPKHLVQEGDVVAITVSKKEQEAPPPQPLSLPIVHEDEHIVVIAKPPGVSVHPGQGREQQTVSGWFAARYPDSTHVGEGERPGIVHRLDKDTSGIMVLAKDKDTFEHLKEQFKKHRVRKEYLALVFGVPGEPKGRITRPLARSKRNPLRRTVDPEGKPAITEWRLEEKFGDRYALIRVYPLTGRTHQIRVHLHFLGFPIVGDTLYTFKRQRPPKGAARHLLHAEKLTFTLRSGKRKTFTAPLPEDFQHVLASLRES
jgi:23S rRNA pseudouridine1911/1915/1917 synthase